MVISNHFYSFDRKKCSNGANINTKWLVQHEKTIRRCNVGTKACAERNEELMEEKPEQQWYKGGLT